MNKWLKLVTKHKVSKNVVPPGWQTREEVAEQLACQVEKVNSILKDAINAGEVEVQSFPVWSSASRKVVSTPCYRIVEPETTPAKRSEKRLRGRPKKPAERGWPYPIGTRVRRCDSPNLGVVIEGGGICWDSGMKTTPRGSTRLKIIPA